VLGGSLYPQSVTWGDNIFYFNHVPPPEHAAFYSSTAITLNLTRGAMAECGYCPSGRLFEAAACGSPILSDWWEGLDRFFTPGDEILIAATTAQALDALELSTAELEKISSAARERTLIEHTAERRVLQLEDIASCGCPAGINHAHVTAQEAACGE
jgi:spore maturation protein CgeB